MTLTGHYLFFYDKLLLLQVKTASNWRKILLIYPNKWLICLLSFHTFSHHPELDTLLLTFALWLIYSLLYSSFTLFSLLIFRASLSFALLFPFVLLSLHLFMNGTVTSTVIGLYDCKAAVWSPILWLQYYEPQLTGTTSKTNIYTYYTYIYI